MSNMLRVLMDKVDSMQEENSDASRKVEILRKKEYSDNISIEISKTGKQREKKTENQQTKTELNIQDSGTTTKKCHIHVMGILEEKRGRNI